MDATLRDLNSLPGVMGSMFCDVQGRILARAFPPGYGETELRQAAAELAERSRGLQKGTGPINLVDLRYADARLLVKPVGDFSLLLLCSKAVNVPMLLVTVSVAGKRLEQLVPANMALDPFDELRHQRYSLARSEQDASVREGPLHPDRLVEGDRSRVLCADEERHERRGCE